MPAIGSFKLIGAVLAAIEDSGYAGIFLPKKGRPHPREILATAPSGETYLLWIYLWILTFGGRPNLPNEYRIQMTTVKAPLALNPDGPTLLMGYEPALGLFAGFDVDIHRNFTPGSPMVSIDIETVKQSMQDGLSFHRKSNREIAIGVRPDQFMNYALHAQKLHKLGRQATTCDLLSRAAATEILSEEEILSLTPERRKIVHTVSRLARDASFKRQVLNAYDNRCAVTRVQLRLVDAAHIVPIGAPESCDDVRNGIALSPTYHRAYDNAVICLDEDYCMHLNPIKEKELISLGLVGGISRFKSYLGKILLPQDHLQWPSKRLIKTANKYRGIAS